MYTNVLQTLYIFSFLEILEYIYTNNSIYRLRKQLQLLQICLLILLKKSIANTNTIEKVMVIVRRQELKYSISQDFFIIIKSTKCIVDIILATHQILLNLVTKLEWIWLDFHLINESQVILETPIHSSLSLACYSFLVAGIQSR